MNLPLRPHKPVFIVSDNIISSLGFTAAENLRRLYEEKTGIGYVEPGRFSKHLLPLALVNDSELYEKTAKASIPDQLGRLEQMMLLSVSDALCHSGINASSKHTVFVVSSTKGSIDGLSFGQPAQLQPMLWALGECIRNYFGNPNQAVVVSNACVSGVLAIEIASRMLRGGSYDHAIIVGGDLITRFVVSGFESFLALSGHPCRPYDVGRNGLTLGEGCAAMILTTRKPSEENGRLITISGGSSSMDAVHISAPDRTGCGLNLAIGRALNHSGIRASEIDAVCAHGTATVYNDDMESHAMQLTDLSGTPIYSLKGYWGHTLGAAGLMETVAVVHSIRQQRLFRTLGFESSGTIKPLNVVSKTQEATLRNVLKTASGFGGCNATLVVSATASKS